MEEVNLLHEKFENQGTKRTYRSGSQAYDVNSETAAAIVAAVCSQPVWLLGSFMLLAKSVAIKQNVSVVLFFVCIDFKLLGNGQGSTEQ